MRHLKFLGIVQGTRHDDKTEKEWSRQFETSHCDFAKYNM